MAGWYHAADERKADDPEKDSVYWVDSAKPEEQGYGIHALQLLRSKLLGNRHEGPEPVPF